MSLARDIPEAHVRVVHRELDEVADVTASGARHSQSGNNREGTR